MNQFDRSLLNNRKKNNGDLTKRHKGEGAGVSHNRTSCSLGAQREVRGGQSIDLHR